MRRTPRRCSNRVISFATADGDNPTSSAAPAKLPRSATRWKMAISLAELATAEIPSRVTGIHYRLFRPCKRSRLCVAAGLSRHGRNNMNTLRKTRFWAAIAVAALLLLGIAGWGNTNANTKNLEAPGPRIDPFQIMLNARICPLRSSMRPFTGFPDEQKCDLYNIDGRSFQAKTW